MVEIKVYETAEEAGPQLEKHERENKEMYEVFAKGQGESATERLKKQTYLFVVELGAYVDNRPDQFYFESAVFPFLGWNELCDDIQSLVERVKDAARHQTPQNIEIILYTVKNHNAENQKFRKGAGESRKIAEKYCFSDRKIEDERDGIHKEERDKTLEMLEDIESAEERGLTEQEREEFVRLYENV